MSQFDFPRINFSGRAFINPGTANNNILLPLVTYDPIRVKAVLPPRIYLSQELLILHKLDALPMPDNQLILEDDDQCYMEIEPINTRQKFIEWATTPLGNSSLDVTYHALYELVTTKRTGKPLTGSLPANWNFYGGMEFGFQNVTVKSVAISDDQLLTPETPECPSDIAEMLGATLRMETETGENRAVMIDVLPGLAMFSQVFCDGIQLQRDESVLLSGKPLKGSLRFLNLNRIVNQEGVLSGSGTFFSVIQLEEMPDGMQSSVMRLFRQYSQKQKPIRGVFIRYNLFEVVENQMPDYSILGTTGNPALSTVMGSLTPWYEGEMKSIAMERQLLPEAPFLTDKVLTSFVCRVDVDCQMVRLDMSGSIPEQFINEQELTYETYSLGTLRLALLRTGKPDITIGTFQIDATHFNRERVLKTGGIIDLSFGGNEALTQYAFDEGLLALYGPSKSAVDAEGNEVLLMKENEYMIASDQAGLYADQGQDVTEGYTSYGLKKEPCQVRVFQRGKPYTETLPMTIMALTITKSGTSSSVSQFLETSSFRDGQTVVFPTDQAANVMYVFYPGLPASVSDNVLADLIKTGFFVSLRVLPEPDYGKYLDPAHPDYPTPITFEVLYEELLQTYDFVFPKASLITPFTEDYFRRGWQFIGQRMAPSNWASATYMPSSRDMHAAKWDLFRRWVTGLITNHNSISRD